jgi:hypothetical protein
MTGIIQMRRAFPRHRCGFIQGGLSLLLSFALLACNTKKAESIATPPPAGVQNPTLKLENFSTQITRNGVPCQTITAEWAELDETEDIMVLRRVRSRFYTKGELQGEARCGYARTWLKDRPAQHIGRNDLEMSDKVFYQMKDGWMLQVPQMKYAHASGTLSADQPYVKQLALKDGYMIGRGDGFTIKLDTAEGRFTNWQEYGKPAVLEHSSIPVLQP